MLLYILLLIIISVGLHGIFCVSTCSGTKRSDSDQTSMEYHFDKWRMHNVHRFCKYMQLHVNDGGVNWLF